MQIELWGTYPPPIGGVSMHVYRLIHYLHLLDPEIILKNFGTKDPNLVYVKTVKRKWIAFGQLLFAPTKIIHLQSNNVVAFLGLLVFGVKHKIGITIHNKNLVAVKSRIKCCIIRCFLKKVSFIILNDVDYKYALIKKFNCKEEKIHILPAFLPPIKMEFKGLDEDILAFRKKHKYLLSANAYKLRLENGVDVYGLDLLIRLVGELRKEGVDVGLIFCLPIIGDIEYYNKCLASIAKLQLQDSIYIVQKNLQNGFEVWKLSDLFIRPTLTDMEGISVKEALFCGTPAIASDVCNRPSEAILFQNRNFEDLKRKVLDVYHNQSVWKNKATLNAKENSVESIIEIYKNLIC